MGEVESILETLGEPYGASRIGAFFEKEMGRGRSAENREEFDNAIRHLVPLSYDAEEHHWRKNPSSPVYEYGSGNLRVVQKRERLRGAEGWQKRLEMYSSDALNNRLSDAYTRFSYECSCYDAHTQQYGSCNASDADSRPLEWSYGFLLGEGFVAVDCDVDDDATSAEILRLFLEKFPSSPIRSRGGSRWAAIVIIDDESSEDAPSYNGWTVALDKVVAQNAEKKQQLEIIGKGKQLVVHGWHPTGAPYLWYGGKIDPETGKVFRGFKKLSHVHTSVLREFRVEVAKRWSSGPAEPSDDCSARTGNREFKWDGLSIRPIMRREVPFYPYIARLQRDGLEEAIRKSDRFISEDSEKIYIRCPNEEHHSADTGEKQCCYFKESGKFNCFHATCKEEMTHEAFKSYFRTKKSIIENLYALNAFVIKEPKNDDPYACDLIAKHATFVTILSDFAYTGIELSYDEFSERELYRIVDDRLTSLSIPDLPVEGEVDELFCSQMTRLMSHIGVSKGITTKDMWNAVEIVCRMHPFDSAVEDVKSLPEWDGVDRVGEFFDRYLTESASRDEVQRSWMSRCSQYMFTALIARMTNVSGAKADISLVLQGRQGSGKSTLCSVLAGDATRYGQYDFSLNATERARTLRGKTVVEIPELVGMSKRDVSEIKATLSQTEDKYRALYKEREERHPRRNIFILTTNDSEFLSDETGNRRFAVVDVGRDQERFLIDEIRRDYRQILAQARVLYEENGIMWEPVADWQDEQNAQAVVDDPWEAALEKYFKSMAWITPSGLSRMMTVALGIEERSKNGKEYKRLTGILKKHGYSKTSIRTKCGAARVWVSRCADLNEVKIGTEFGMDAGIFGDPKRNPMDGVAPTVPAIDSTAPMSETMFEKIKRGETKQSAPAHERSCLPADLEFSL